MWTKLYGSNLWKDVEWEYSKDPRRCYHNWAHIQRLYWHCEFTFYFPYCESLDLAILAHDVVYDEKLHKEIRSSAWLCERDIFGEKLDVAIKLIDTTISHRPEEDNRMILLDLADFMFEAQTIANYHLIKHESMKLYNCSEIEFAKNNIKFLEGLKKRLSTVPDDASANDKIWFIDIRSGIDTSIEESEKILRG